MRTFKIGQTVHCPADNGDPAYVGTVTSIDPTEQTNIHGVKYHWVHVKANHGPRQAWWPSHRIG